MVNKVVSMQTGGECGVVTNAFFDMPYQGNYTSATGKTRAVEWYSFDQGPVGSLKLLQPPSSCPFESTCKQPST